MPSSYVHFDFAKDVNNELKKKKIYQINNDKLYLVFAQSFDNLFSYNILSIKKGKKIRKLGYYAQTHKVSLYFSNMIEYIKENKLYDDENLGYLYGSLCHYALDSACHPYIHYISGRVSKSNYKNTKQYLGNHTLNEVMLDAIFYNNDTGKEFYKYKIYKDLTPKVHFSKSLKDTVTYTFKSTFDAENMGEIYNKSFNQINGIYKILMYDRFGIKKFFYLIFDFLFSKLIRFKSAGYSLHVKKLDKSILNEEHNKWHHPVTNEIHNESFYDLYNFAKENATKYISIVNKFFNDKCSIEDVKKTIGNISYSSGLDCREKVEFKYFKQ